VLSTAKYFHQRYNSSAIARIFSSLYSFRSTAFREFDISSPTTLLWHRLKCDLSAQDSLVIGACEATSLSIPVFPGNNINRCRLGIRWGGAMSRGCSDSETATHCVRLVAFCSTGCMADCYSILLPCCLYVFEDRKIRKIMSSQGKDFYKMERATLLGSNS
jgi:hypothetical protein